jgi:hypothetical protein
MQERGATETEVEVAIRDRERFPAKFGRQGFRRNLNFDGNWLGHQYGTKQIEAIAIYEDGDWLVISVIVKYF